MTAAPIARRTRRTRRTRRPASPTSRPAPRSAPRASSRALRTGSLVGGRGLCPQVEFGAVSLDLPPYGRQAERHDGQHDQLLHSVLPLPSHHGTRLSPCTWFSPCPPESRASLASQRSPTAIHAPGVPDRLWCLGHVPRLAEHDEPVERPGEPPV